MSDRSWIGDGLCFSCTRCGRCCEGPGFVWVSDAEVEAMASHLGLSLEAFGRRFLRRVRGRLSLIEKPDDRCIFLGTEDNPRACAIYSVRPRQCRTFPFWPEHVASRESWEAVEASCPGAGEGALHSRAEIEAALAPERADDDAPPTA